MPREERCQRAAGSGGNELVIVAMEAVAQAVPERSPSAPGSGRGRMISRTSPFWQNRNPPLAHPHPNVRGVAVELERPRIDGRPLGPRDRRLRRDDIEDVHPPRRAIDDLEAAVAPDRHVVRHDRGDVHAEVVEWAHRADGIAQGLRISRQRRDVVGNRTRATTAGRSARRRRAPERAHPKVRERGSADANAAMWLEIGLGATHSRPQRKAAASTGASAPQGA